GRREGGGEGMGLPPDADNWEILGPPPIKHYPFMQSPRAMTRADMVRVRDQFVEAARMADQAGADMLELHMAHGYLLSNFITPVSNQRRDKYGGSLEQPVHYAPP